MALNTYIYNPSDFSIKSQQQQHFNTHEVNLSELVKNILFSLFYFRCPRYPQIPSYCVLVQDKNDQCCKVPSCSILAPTPNPPFNPTPKPGQPTLVPGMGTTLSPIMTPPTQAPQPVVKGEFQVSCKMLLSIEK